MILYVSTILISMAIIILCNGLFTLELFGFDIFYVILAVVISTVGVIIVDLIFAFIVRRLLPSKWFGVDKKCYVPKKRECRFYEKLKIKAWKDKVLELGAVTGFRKNKLAKPDSLEYLERFIVEANYGIVVHLVCAILGFLIIFFYPLKYFLCFGVPVGFVNAVLNILPLFILRYNLPKLHTLYKYNLKKQQRDKE